MAGIDFATHGPPGADGNSFLWFRRDPTAADGRFGDTAINLNTTLVFAKDENGVWQPQFEMRGRRGAGGLPGPQGYGFLSGTTAPASTLGRDGDFYLLQSAYGTVLYGPKSNGAWPVAGMAVTGLITGVGAPGGSVGFDGQTYLDYQNAVLYGAKTNGAWPPGTTLRGLLVGSGPPASTTGFDGQTYIDTAAVAFYGPKAGGAWPSTPTPLVGLLTGSGAPANSLGLNGQTYIDRTNFVLYGPKAAGVWPAGTSFLGKAPLKPVEAWASGVAYTAGPPSSFVSFSGSSYQCLISHTSGSSFATDLSAGRWGLVASKGLDGNLSTSGSTADGEVAVYLGSGGTTLRSGGPFKADPLDASLVVPTLDAFCTFPDAVQPAWFTRGSLGYRVRASGLLESVAANTLRIDHDATGVTLGALIEETRTNYLLNSFAPATQTVSLAAGTYTLSLIGNGSTALSGGPTGTATAASPVTFTLGGTVSVTVTVSGSVSQFQIENGAFRTSPIATTTAAATRAADSLIVPASADWLNTAEGTFYFEGYAPSAYGPNSAYLFDLNDGSASNRILARLTSAGVLGVLLFSGGSGLPGVSPGSVAAGALMRLAFSIKAGSLVASLNGAAVVSSAPASVPVGLASLVVGNMAGGTGAALNAPVRRLAYVPRALPDALLQRMTA